MTVARTRLRKLDAALARKVAEKLCARYGGKITDIVKDYYGNKVKVLVGIDVDGVSVGFSEKNGSVNVLSDRYLWRKAGKLEVHDRIVREFVKLYTAEAVSRALMKEGYDIRVQEYLDGVVIDAYR